MAAKGFVFWVLIFLAVLLCSAFSSSVHVSDSSSNTRGRKLKVTIFERKRATVQPNTNDYNPDPTPIASRDQIRTGPIQHGTPLMPFIPKPSPPGYPPDTTCLSSKCATND
ncbi:uncharacterized protein LOC124911361 [Impatiens glandulifera]|uniref:uncharacterized protein LOC124911361 n=1 Tax=Impatiens glandulifera TaxID=253017 RepID=UPI001FB06788|nr:uncharacterized protein LOC124911361 [Impatiens glandulifera]